MGHFHLFMFIFLKHFAVAVTSLKKGEGVKVTIWVASWRVETETTKEHKQQDPEIDALHHVLADGKINFHIFITDKEISKIVCIMRKTTSMAKSMLIIWQKCCWHQEEYLLLDFLTWVM